MSTSKPLPEPNVTELEARIAELEERNRALAARIGVEADGIPGRRWRAFLAALLIVLGAVLAPVAVVTSWTRATVTDTDGFVATYGPLIREPQVQAYVRDQVVTAIEAKIDIDQLVSDVVDGLRGVVGDRPRVSAALGLLAGPAADGVRSAITRATDKVVTSEAFATTWEQALRVSHAQLVGALSGDPTVVATITADGLGIQLGPIVDRVRAELTEQGFALAGAIPQINRTIVVVNSADLAQVQAWYQFGTAVGPWLPWVSLALLAAGVLVARRRRFALVGAALALVLVGGVLAAGLAIARALLPVIIPASVMPPAVADIMFETVASVLSDTALATLVLGLVVAVIGWWHGPSRTATRLRAGSGRLADDVRGSLADRGLGTGRFGLWLSGHRTWVSVAIAVFAVVILLTNRPLSVGEILATAAVSLAVLAFTRLLEAPRDVATAAAGESA
jgi:hypothetical protein